MTRALLTRAGIDDRLASGGVARDAGVLDPVAPFRPPAGTAGRTPEARQQGLHSQPSPDDLRRDPAVSGQPETHQRRVDPPGGGGTPPASGGTPPGDTSAPPGDSRTPPADDGPGGFAETPESKSERAAQYQAEVTGTPSGQSYVVDGVKFDGFADRSLLDAKGPGYEQFVDAYSGSFKPWYRGADQLV